MDFETAKKVGYYFDRCIDLDFYNTDMEHIASLKTPKHGMKPTITIKGIFIEGGYAIDSYISIQNMAFDIDVSYVGYIRARMYYSGLEENTEYLKPISNKVRNGHTILYRVLYADQEKEPPNRCVRFQCVVASKDTTMYDTPLIISTTGLKYLDESKSYPDKYGRVTNKNGKTAPLKNLCEDLIDIYNTGIQKNTLAGKSPILFNNVKISILEIDEPLENKDVVLPFGVCKIGDYIRLLNNNVAQTEYNGFTYSTFKIVIDRGVMRDSTPVPSNWKKIAMSEGYSKDKLSEYYAEKYLNTKTNTYTVVNHALIQEQETPVVPLNFVKSATRSECVIYVETLFDDRITPGCHVAIKSNAIMGKKFGSSKGKNGGSRILNYLDSEEPVVFRNTGKIEYLFSTTEDSYMKMQGPVDESVDASVWYATARQERKDAIDAMESKDE